MKAIILAREKDPKGLIRICGLPLLKRNLYLLRWAGIREVTILTRHHASWIEKEIGKGEDLGMKLEFREEGQDEVLSSLKQRKGLFLIIDGDCIFDTSLLESLLRCKGTVLCCDSHPEKSLLRRSPKILSQNGRIKKIGQDLTDWDKVYAGIALCDGKILSPDDILSGQAQWPICLNKILPEEEISYLNLSLSASYNSELRREVKPFWWRISSKEDLKIAKKKLIQGTQKRTLDVLAWYFHRPLENKIIHYLSELPITPNQLTLATNLLAFSVTFLFFKGYLLIASLLTFLVNIMDGLDGKQARAKGIITKLGTLEHSLDALYEQSWYIAFSWAVFTLTKSLLPLQLCLVMILFDTFSRHCYLQFRGTMKVPLADYAPFDRAFRRFDGRRNIYTIYILIGVLSGLPLYSLFAMVIHAILTGVVYFLRAARHMHAADMGR